MSLISSIGSVAVAVVTNAPRVGVQIASSVTFGVCTPVSVLTGAICLGQALSCKTVDRNLGKVAVISTCASTIAGAVMGATDVFIFSERISLLNKTVIGAFMTGGTSILGMACLATIGLVAYGCFKAAAIH